MGAAEAFLCLLVPCQLCTILQDLSYGCKAVCARDQRVCLFESLWYIARRMCKILRNVAKALRTSRCSPPPNHTSFNSNTFKSIDVPGFINDGCLPSDTIVNVRLKSTVQSSTMARVHIAAALVTATLSLLIIFSFYRNTAGRSSISWACNCLGNRQLQR